ncbi:MAG TPA: inorganic diphosphatase [Stellaceae bacterium]|nr:inorganic diphosphatase [Stellaceae bacterium]
MVIETPKGSRNKYDYDPQCDCMALAAVLPEGMSFPYDFGFASSTLGQDGDPLDPRIHGCAGHTRMRHPRAADRRDPGQAAQRKQRRMDLRGREFKPQRDAVPARAQKLLTAGVKAFRQQKNGHAR